MLNSLNKNEKIKISSKIPSLHPFIDQDKIIRVEGKLQNFNARFGIKHQTILDRGHIFSLIIEDAHNQTLHGGIKLIRTYVQRKYWILGLR